MFRVRADFRDDVEIGAGVERVRAFFGDLQNLARLMPGIEKIEEEVGGVIRWTVRAEITVAGAMRGQFALVQTDNSPLRVEWGPAPIENKNYLRYAASFEDRGSKATIARVAMRVELRRRHATELHLMAGLIGANRISAEMQRRLDAMMKTFLERVRRELEKHT